jgi:hypothetical protein
LPIHLKVKRIATAIAIVIMAVSIDIESRRTCFSLFGYRKR